jgi:hypothetical protein
VFRNAGWNYTLLLLLSCNAAHCCCCCLQVFRDAGWDGKTPALPQPEHKMHHKHHKSHGKDSNAADAEAWQAAAAADDDDDDDEAMEASYAEDLLDAVEQEVDREHDHELEDEDVGAQDPASAAADVAADSAMPSLEVVKLARAAAVRQQAQLAGQGLGWSKPWWQRQHGLQLQWLRGGRKPEVGPTTS